MVWQQHIVFKQDLAIAVQEHGDKNGPVVLAMHGWRDNSASFKPLAEALPHLRILAMDFPGHGLSANRHAQADYAIWTYLSDVLAVLDKLVTGPCILLGHSMGGAVAILFAALYPERVAKLVLLDAIGPFVTPPAEVPAQMLNAMQLLRTRKLNYRHHYPDMASAVMARANKGLSEAASMLFAQRGVMEDEKGFYWQLDARLSMKNMLGLTEEQAESFIRLLRCPVMLIAAKEFWLERQAWFEQRLGYFQQLETHMLDGGHHQHMEAQKEQVATLIKTFIS